SPSEGWVATTNAPTGGPAAASFTVGHFTDHPQPSQLARWPNPAVEPLYGVAVSPDGQRAMAVGDIAPFSGDTAMLYRPGVGWDQFTSVALTNLRSAAWSSNDEAWAVGTNGGIVRLNGTTF